MSRNDPTRVPTSRRYEPPLDVRPEWLAPLRNRRAPSGPEAATTAFPSVSHDAAALPTPTRAIDEECGLVTTRHAAPDSSVEPAVILADSGVSLGQAAPPEVAGFRRSASRWLTGALAFGAGGLLMAAFDRLQPAQAPTASSQANSVSRDDWRILQADQQALLRQMEELANRPAPTTESITARTSTALEPIQRGLHALTERVDTLVPVSTSVAGLTKQVDGLAEHLRAVDAGLERLGRAIPRQSVMLKPAADSINQTSHDARARLFTLGAELIRQRRHDELREAFRVGRVIEPEDPRVWYFAGLASSLRAGQLDVPEAVGLFRKGAALELAGKVAPDEIDATFAFLKGTNEHAWLEYYRFGERPGARSTTPPK